VAADVLHVAQPTSAGVAVCVEALVRSQLAAGLAVAVACPESAFSSTLAAAGADVRPWAATRSPGASTLAETRRLRAVVTAVDPRVVHLHSAKAGLAGRLALRGSKPTIFQPHAWSFHAVGGLVGRASLLWERIATRWTDVLVCVSEAEREQGVAAGLDAPWRVIPNAVDLERFAPTGPDARAAARAALGLDDAPLALCLGRLSRQKGQDVLLDAWPSLRAAVPEAQLAFVGDGPERDSLLARATPGVTFHRGVADVREWLVAADVVVAPSRWDGMSLVLLEAMASARCIVATDVPGAGEALGPDAELVPPGKAAPLARALAARLGDAARRDAEAAANRIRAEEHYGLERMTAAHLALIAELSRRRS
jgi:glycosyltransferase involved in cell wall biosynthesis